MSRGSLVLLLLTPLLAPAAALAALPDAWMLTGCLCDDREALIAQRDRIADAATLDEARELALAPAAQAESAVARARWLAPRSAALSDAAARLADYARKVRAASSEAEVATTFGALVQLAASQSVMTDASFDAKCNYSTGEIIAIVLGFILGIIPGIILLILLC